MNSLLASRRLLGPILASLAAVGLVACADAYLGTNPGTDAGTDANGPTEAGPLDSSPPADASLGADVDAARVDSGMVDFADDFNRSDAAIRPPWDGTNTRNGGVELVLSGSSVGDSERALRGSFVDTLDAGSSAAALFKRFPYALLSGRATFAMRIEAFDATDGGTVDSMHFFTVEIPVASASHVLRVGLRRRSSGFAVFTASQFIPGGYRSSDDSAVRLQVGTTYLVAVDYDVNAPAAGKPMVSVSIDGTPAASVDGTAEVAQQNKTPTTMNLGPTSGSGASWTVAIDDFKASSKAF